MNARRTVVVALALCAVFVVAAALIVIARGSRRNLSTPPSPGFLAPGARRLLPGLVFRDGSLAPSRDGRFLIVAVRRRDTNGDGRVTVRDAKALWLLDETGETFALCDDLLVWQDKPVRWSPDGRLVALALPGLASDWTHFDPPDVVVYDPASRREIARHPRGINPLWLSDGRLAFQRENAICVASGEMVATLPMPAELEGRNLLRSFVEDPWRRRIIASYSGIADVRMRSERMTTEGKPGLIHAWSEGPDGWRVRALPFDGFSPRPAADGLYWFARRGDASGNGTYELAQDGVNLMRDEELVAEDVAFNSFFDLEGLRAVILRRAGRFELVELDSAGRVLRPLVPGLVRHGATWLAGGGGRLAMSAVLGETEGRPSLYLLDTDAPGGAVGMTLLADGPVTQPFVTARGVYCLRAAGERPGEILFIPFDE